jgi:hypothetical protein
MKEAILPSLPWFLVFVLVLPLIVFLAFVLLMRRLVLFYFQHLLSLLIASLLFYVKNLLIRALLRLRLALASIAPLNIPATCLVLLVLILLFQPSSEVIV